MFSFEPLWQTMKKKNMTTYRLIQSGIDKHTIFNLQHNKNVTIVTLERLCKILDCAIEDIVVIKP